MIRIYNPQTQEEYDYLMEELEKEGHIWWKQGDIRYNPTDIDNYYVFGEDTCIIVNPLDEEIDFCSISVAESEYNIDIKPVVMENPETKYTVVVPNGDIFLRLKRLEEGEIGRMTLSRDGDLWHDSDKGKNIDLLLFTESEIKKHWHWAWSYAIPYQKKYYIKIIDDGVEVLHQIKKDGRLIFQKQSIDTDYTKCRFSEEEIKAIDERYWQFAVEVKE